MTTVTVQSTATPGPQGAPGSQIWYGTGTPPSGLGANGDTYIQTTSTGTSIWGPKANGAWPGSPAVTLLASTTTAGGDLTGDYPSPTLAATANVEAIIRANRLDQLATPTADVAWGGHKITGLANGVAASDAATVGQIPTNLSPTGPASGDLGGTYPNPQVITTHLAAPLPIVQGGTATSAAPAVGQVCAATSSTTTGWFSAVGVGSHVFDIRTYGALGNGVTDDSAALAAAVADAVTYARNHAGYAEVWVPPASVFYPALNIPVTGSPYYGNAQIPIPIVPVTERKVTLVIRGMWDSSAMPHWNQTTPQLSGSTIVSNLLDTDSAHVATYGEASVIGGPTPQQGYGGAGAVFSNILVVLDGVQIVTPNNANGQQASGVDLRGCAEMDVPSLACLVNAYPGNLSHAGLGAGWAFGLGPPGNGNNDLNRIGSYSCQGYTYGLLATEHLVAQRVASIYCWAGITVVGTRNSGVGAVHGVTITGASVEACNVTLQVIGAGSNGIGPRVDIPRIDTEGSFVLLDPTSEALGDIGVYGSFSSVTVDTTRIRVRDCTRPPGAVATGSVPAVPGTGTPLRNPFWRDAAVTISGGSVTAVTIDGVAQATTSGTFLLPPGLDITLIYSAAPTWSWVLL